MIAVKIEGRLGNQMFQYAFIYTGARRLNTSFYIDKGIEKFKLYEYFEITKDRFYLIDKYIFSIQGFKNIFCIHLKRFFYESINKLFFGDKSITINNEQSINEAIQGMKNKQLYIGFFQSERYFIDYKKEVKSLFSIKEEFKSAFQSVTKGLDLQRKIVVVHVRRGDYVGLGLTINTSYYHNAIKQVDDKDAFFVFISDDSKFVESEFSHISNKFISSNPEIIDFQFLQCADICILSNSSFSWWGAYLNEKNPKVIVPKYWLGSREEKEIPINVILDKWIQL